VREERDVDLDRGGRLGGGSIIGQATP
jgi:hypothetical protein